MERVRSSKLETTQNNNRVNSETEQLLPFYGRSTQSTCAILSSSSTTTPIFNTWPPSAYSSSTPNTTPWDKPSLWLPYPLEYKLPLHSRWISIPTKSSQYTRECHESIQLESDEKQYPPHQSVSVSSQQSKILKPNKPSRRLAQRRNKRRALKGNNSFKNKYIQPLINRAEKSCLTNFTANENTQH